MDPEQLNQPNGHIPSTLNAEPSPRLPVRKSARFKVMKWLLIEFIICPILTAHTYVFYQNVTQSYDMFKDTYNIAITSAFLFLIELIILVGVYKEDISLSQCNAVMDICYTTVFLYFVIEEPDHHSHWFGAVTSVYSTLLAWFYVFELKKMKAQRKMAEAENAEAFDLNVF